MWCFFTFFKASLRDWYSPSAVRLSYGVICVARVLHSDRRDQDRVYAICIQIL